MAITRLPTTRLKLTEIELCAWLGQALPGDTLEYHRGFLAIDIMPHSGRLAGQDRPELARIARRAWWAAERQFVDLVQRRHGPDDYSYLLIARCRPSSRSQSLSQCLTAEIV